MTLTRTEMALLFPLLLVPLALLARSLARRERFKLAVVGCVVGAALIPSAGQLRCLTHRVFGRYVNTIPGR